MKVVSTTSKLSSDKKDSPRKLAVVRTSLRTIAELREAASVCRACDLYKKATQTIFGKGPAKSQIMFVGEQPGDKEDRVGHPFVGPAGKLLEQALETVGIEHSKVYLTNVVKHFKWAAAARGKKRIHKKPRYSEIHACRPWLEAELRVVKPRILVCLGSTAAQSLLGRTFSVTRQRGQLIDSPLAPFVIALAPFVIATVHPSSILRAPNSDARQLQMQAFIDDLRIVSKLARKAKAA